jgi:hypothetical protein
MIRHTAPKLLLPLIMLPFVGCSSSVKSGQATGQATGQTWTRIIEGSWTLAAGTENPRVCVKKHLTEDIYVKAIRPVHPPGTHHTLVTLSDDDSVDCTTAVVNGFIYGAGIGSEGLELPPGVAIKLPKGKVLNLGLHVYNTGSTELKGTSAIEIQTMAAADVKYESEAVLSGPFTISLPPHEVTTLKDDCNITTDQKIYALFPHMHQLGKHIKTTFTMSGSERVIHDGDYSFNEQFQIPLDPVTPLNAGDVVTTECTFDNTTDRTVTFGESSDTEMCFSVLFRYPKQGAGFCTSGGGGAGAALNGPPCAASGAPGNENGVGKQCSKGGSECAGNASAKICLADYTSGTFGNFCTLVCQSDTDCGTGTVCRGSPGRSICTPNACVPTDGGAGAASADGG